MSRSSSDARSRAASTPRREVVGRIRAAIGPLHDRIEATPLARALADGSFHRADYRKLHVQLWHLHHHVEPFCAEAPPACDFFEAAWGRLAAVTADLEALQVRPPVPVPTAATTALLAWLKRVRTDGPVLLGCLYVLEGSRLGGRMLAPVIARGLGVAPVPGAGLDYYLHRQQDVPRHWRAFLDRLDAAGFSEAEQAGIVSGAREMMAGLLRIYDHLGRDSAPVTPPGAGS